MIPSGHVSFLPSFRRGRNVGLIDDGWRDSFFCGRRKFALKATVTFLVSLTNSNVMTLSKGNRVYKHGGHDFLRIIEMLKDSICQEVGLRLSKDPVES